MPPKDPFDYLTPDERLATLEPTILERERQLFTAQLDLEAADTEPARQRVEDLQARLDRLRDLRDEIAAMKKAD